MTTSEYKDLKGLKKESLKDELPPLKCSGNKKEFLVF